MTFDNLLERIRGWSTDEWTVDIEYSLHTMSWLMTMTQGDVIHTKIFKHLDIVNPAVLKSEAWSFYTQVVRSKAAPVATPQDLCPECKGTGEYIGFTVIEPCRACQGAPASDIGLREEWEAQIQPYLKGRTIRVFDGAQYRGKNGLYEYSGGFWSKITEEQAFQNWRERNGK